MKFLYKIPNGILLIIIGLMHTKMMVSPTGAGKQFMKFSETYFYKIAEGRDALPIVDGNPNIVAFAVFWAFYFGLFLIPLGLLVFSIEKAGKALPLYFTISYLLFILIGSYMIPNSGMTLIMLPHAVFMLIINYLKSRKLRRADMS